MKRDARVRDDCAQPTKEQVLVGLFEEVCGSFVFNILDFYLDNRSPWSGVKPHENVAVHEQNAHRRRHTSLIMSVSLAS
jgi:hypothetical protein